VWWREDNKKNSGSLTRWPKSRTRKSKIQKEKRNPQLYDWSL